MLQPAATQALTAVPYREYVLIALVAAIMTYLATGAIRLVAFRTGAVAIPRERDAHSSATPRLGGVSIAIGFLLAIFLANQLPVLGKAFQYTQEVRGAILSAIFIVLVGVFDDKFGLSALTKLLGQSTAAAIMVYHGIQWTSIWVPWGSEGARVGSILVLNSDQSAVVTLVISVALINAMNFVDGLDGLAAGVGLITGSAVCIFSVGIIWQSGGEPTGYPPALISAALTGGCAGFLPHNFSPARLFMGDSGSMLIGITLAAAITSAAGRVSDPAGSSEPALTQMTPLIVSAAVVVFPMLDLLLAIARRTRAGVSPFAADKLHLHHRLLNLGHSHRRVSVLIYLWVGIIAYGAVALAVFDAHAVAVAAGTLVALVVALVLTALKREWTTKRAHRKS